MKMARVKRSAYNVCFRVRCVSRVPYANYIFGGFAGGLGFSVFVVINKFLHHNFSYLSELFSECSCLLLAKSRNAWNCGSHRSKYIQFCLLMGQKENNDHDRSKKRNCLTDFIHEEMENPKLLFTAKLEFKPCIYCGLLKMKINKSFLNFLYSSRISVCAKSWRRV